MRDFARGISGALGTIWRAIRARPGVFAGVALAVVLLDVFLPVAVLSLARKPFDHFSFNPWLANLPSWAMSHQVTLARKVEFLSDVAIFWFIASSPYDAPEWGFSAGVQDIARWLYMGIVFGAYFALWSYARRGAGRGATLERTGRLASGRGGGGGVGGAILSTLGLFTSPCGVAGCGAPVLPVLGLAFQGLTSGTLAALSTLSRVAAVIVLTGATLAVLVLAWMINRVEAAGEAGAPAPQRGTGPAPLGQPGG